MSKLTILAVTPDAIVAYATDAETLVVKWLVPGRRTLFLPHTTRAEAELVAAAAYRGVLADAVPPEAVWDVAATSRGLHWSC